MENSEIHSTCDLYWSSAWTGDEGQKYISNTVRKELIVVEDTC